MKNNWLVAGTVFPAKTFLLGENVKRKDLYMKIAEVTVYLDNNMPEYMAGIYRVGMVETDDGRGHVCTHNELVDNAEFLSENELVASVAKRLKVSPAIVSIDGYDAEIG